jgi:hypothetical protein
MERRIEEGLKVYPGLEIEVRGLRWDAQWEFDCPTAIISPVFRAWENGRDLDGALEDVLIDAVVDGELKGEDPSFWERGRGWSRAYLRRKFYRKGTERLRAEVRFVLDEHGRLSWEVLSQDPPAPDA